MANPLTVNTSGFDNGIRPTRGGDFIEDQIGTFIANEAMVSGDLVRIRSDNKIELADANAGKEDVRGFIYKPVAANSNGVSVHRRGAVSGYNGLVTPGAALYLSATPGKIATVDPVGAEVQTITITGTPNGGDFTLTFDGQTTAAIAYNAAASAVVSALELLSTIDVGDVVGGGGALPGTPVTITFVGRFRGGNPPLMTANGAGLTGGTSPAIAVTASTPATVRVPVGFGYQKDGLDVVFFDIPIL